MMHAMSRSSEPPLPVPPEQTPGAKPPIGPPIGRSSVARERYQWRSKPPVPKNHRRIQAFNSPFDLQQSDRFEPWQRRLLFVMELLALMVGTAAAVLRHGLRTLSTPLAYELGTVVIGSLILLAGTLMLRDRASLVRDTFRRRKLLSFILLAFWLAGSAAVLLAGPDHLGLAGGRWENVLIWSDLIMACRMLASGVGYTRGVTAGEWNPGLVLSGTFVVLISVGTLLLMLPKCRAETAPPLSLLERTHVAFFTATSASCVTGLIIVPTGGPHRYWSSTGQAVICGLFQIGGLGIMTCGAFFAIASTRSLRLREAATLRELFDSDQPVNVRRLVLLVLAYTFGCELVGAISLSGLWTDLPFIERAGYSLFHSISAFCNAGFDLTGQSFLGLAHRAEVWGAVSALIVLGGLGFGTLYSLAHAALGQWQRIRMNKEKSLLNSMQQSNRQTDFPRVSVSARLVLMTTAILLIGGTTWIYFFEAMPHGTGAHSSHSHRLADAWFQSVTFRTAGFNTVDMAQLRPASKLFAVVLMFIGASPVSTGGGVKTTVVAVALLALAAILRGRPHAEVFGRMIPDEVVKRALTVIALGGTTVIVVTMLLAAFEDEKNWTLVDLLFEAASACGTVGVSTGLTADLSVPSQFVLVVAMFLGRIGPLTLLLGLARQNPGTSEFEYPEERVTLG